MEVVYEAFERVTMEHPYLSGFLAFREVRLRCNKREAAFPYLRMDAFYTQFSIVTPEFLVVLIYWAASLGVGVLYCIELIYNRRRLVLWHVSERVPPPVADR